MQSPIITKTGWLVKQGGNHKSWKRRWFQLRSSCLYYFKDEKSSRPLGVVPLVGLEVQIVPSALRKWCFEVVLGDNAKTLMDTSRQSFVMQAISQHEMEGWITCIRRQCYADRGGGIFGTRLEETLRREHRGKNAIPAVVEKTAEFLIKSGSLKEEGIFRVGGLASRVALLKEAFDMGKSPDLSLEEDHNVVASVLKMYLRELPEPLLQHRHYNACIANAKEYHNNQEKALRNLAEIINKLPVANRNLLHFLATLLLQVHEHRDSNKMPLSNLAVIFGPNLVRNPNANLLDQMEDENLVNMCVCIIIQNHHHLMPRKVVRSASVSSKLVIQIINRKINEPVNKSMEKAKSLSDLALDVRTSTESINTCAGDTECITFAEDESSSCEDEDFIRGDYEGMMDSKDGHPGSIQGTRVHRGSSHSSNISMLDDMIQGLSDALAENELRKTPAPSPLCLSSSDAFFSESDISSYADTMESDLVKQEIELLNKELVEQCALRDSIEKRILRIQEQLEKLHAPIKL